MIILLNSNEKKSFIIVSSIIYTTSFFIKETSLIYLPAYSLIIIIKHRLKLQNLFIFNSTLSILLIPWFIVVYFLTGKFSTALGGISPDFFTYFSKVHNFQSNILVSFNISIIKNLFLIPLNFYKTTLGHFFEYPLIILFFTIFLTLPTVIFLKHNKIKSLLIFIIFSLPISFIVTFLQWRPSLNIIFIIFILLLNSCNFYLLLNKFNLKIKNILYIFFYITIFLIIIFSNINLYHKYSLNFKPEIKNRFTEQHKLMANYIINKNLSNVIADGYSYEGLKFYTKNKEIDLFEIKPNIVNLVNSQLLNADNDIAFMFSYRNNLSESKILLIYYHHTIINSYNSNNNKYVVLTERNKFLIDYYLLNTKTKIIKKFKNIYLLKFENYSKNKKNNSDICFNQNFVNDFDYLKNNYLNLFNLLVKNFQINNNVISKCQINEGFTP